MSTTQWKRLRLVVVARETDQETLRRLADWIDAGKELSADDRRAAASYLRHLATSPRALKAITGTGRGRPRASKHPHIALDYLVQRELHGPRRWKMAQSSVAAAWCVAPGTVADAWTDCQHYARYELDQLTGWTRSDLPRRELLEAVSADLRDSHAPKPRRK
jgi:hypothetical protein